MANFFRPQTTHVLMPASAETHAQQGLYCYLQYEGAVFKSLTSHKGGGFIHGAATQGRGGYFWTSAHISQWRLLLHRTVAKKRSIRLLVENGAGWQSRKIGYRRSRQGENHSRSGNRLLPKGARTVPAISQSSILETRLEIIKGGKGRPCGLL